MVLRVDLLEPAPPISARAFAPSSTLGEFLVALLYPSPCPKGRVVPPFPSALICEEKEKEAE